MRDTAWAQLQLLEMTITFRLSGVLNCPYTQPRHSCPPNLQRQSPVSPVHFGEISSFPLAGNLMSRTGYTRGSPTPENKQEMAQFIDL